jgi:phosphoglycolate phosphatase-like HAD superfamily hydrolase
MRLILWDIDGTLIRARGLFGRVWYDALKTVYQLEGELARIEMAGKTDGQIALEILALHGWTEAAAIPHWTGFASRTLPPCTRSGPAWPTTSPSCREYRRP